MRDLIQEQHPDVEVRPSPNAACHIEVVPEMVGGRRQAGCRESNMLQVKERGMGPADCCLPHGSRARDGGLYVAG